MRLESRVMKLEGKIEPSEDEKIEAAREEFTELLLFDGFEDEASAQKRHARIDEIARKYPQAVRKFWQRVLFERDE
jgi:hypothetical protein